MFSLYKEIKWDSDYLHDRKRGIYDPQAGDPAVLLVSVWDFFGEYENDSGEGEKTGGTLVREEYNSFLTINAVDGTVINRESGY